MCVLKGIFPTFLTVTALVTLVVARPRVEAQQQYYPVPGASQTYQQRQPQDPYCAQAVRRTERAICSNPRLADIDTKMKMSYENATRAATNKDELSADQQKWLEQRNRFCDAAPPQSIYECIFNADNQRITSINQAVDKMRKVVAEKAERGRAAAELAADAGYDRVGFDDYLLDTKLLQTSGRKISISGFYHKFGGIEELERNAIDAIQSSAGSTPIFLLTEDANRDFRATLLRCSGSICEVRVRGYVSTCSLTLFGNSVSKACIIVENGTVVQ